MSKHVGFLAVTLLGVLAAIGLRTCGGGRDSAELSDGFEKRPLARPSEPSLVSRGVPGPARTEPNPGNDDTRSRNTARLQVIDGVGGPGLGGITIRLRDYRGHVPGAVSTTDAEGYAFVSGALVGRYCTPELLSDGLVSSAQEAVVLNDGLVLIAEPGCQLYVRIEADDPAQYLGQVCEFAVDSRVYRVAVADQITRLGVFRGGIVRIHRIGNELPEKDAASVALPLQGEVHLAFRPSSASTGAVHAVLADGHGSDFRVRLISTRNQWHSPDVAIEGGHARFLARPAEYQYLVVSGGRSAGGRLTITGDARRPQEWKPNWLDSVSIRAESKLGVIESAELYVLPRELGTGLPIVESRSAEPRSGSQFMLWDDLAPNRALKWLGTAHLDRNFVTWTGVPAGSTALVLIRGIDWSAESEPTIVAERGVTLVPVQRVPTLTLRSSDNRARSTRVRVAARGLSADGTRGQPMVVGESTTFPVFLFNHSKKHDRLEVSVTLEGGADLFEWEARSDSTRQVSPRQALPKHGLRVVGWNNAPLAGVPVVASVSDQPDTDAITNEKGVCTFLALAGSEVRANVLGPHYRSKSVALRMNGVVTLQATVLHAVEVSNAGSLIPIARITVEPREGAFDQFEFRFESGASVRITHLPPGTYSVRVQKRTGETWSAALEREVVLGDERAEAVRLSVP